MSDTVEPIFFAYINVTFVNNITETLDEDPSAQCIKLARQFPEPYTAEYQEQKIDLDGPMYAFYRMRGERIAKSQIEAQRNASVPDCRLAIKVKNRELYVYRGNKCFSTVNDRNNTGLRDRYERQLELMLLALEIYDVPDSDFMLGLSDGPIPLDKKGERPPGLSYCIVGGDSQRDGFTYPSYGAYGNALGKQQASHRFYQTEVKKPSSGVCS